MTLRIKIIPGPISKAIWYRSIPLEKYVFDVSNQGDFYKIAMTEHNLKIFEEIGPLLRLYYHGERKKQDTPEQHIKRFGIEKANSYLVEYQSNKEAVSLLEKEY